MAAARINAGLQKTLELGNLSAKRDWGHSQDYVRAMWLMLQQDKPGDYVIASGETHEVREFVTLAFHYAGMDIEWYEQDADEYGVLKDNNKIVVEVNLKFYRPAEVELLHGDCSNAEKQLGWKREISYNELVKRMVEHDMELIKQ
jgi:GDPmannose 4,6-dehydratase